MLEYELTEGELAPIYRRQLWDKQLVMTEREEAARLARIKLVKWLRKRGMDKVDCQAEWWKLEKELGASDD